MAKRSQRYTSDEDTVGEDSVEQTDTNTETEGNVSDPTEAGSGKEEYVVGEAGTVIDGKYFPNSNAEPGLEMIAYLDPVQAEELMKNGVALSKKEEQDTGESADETHSGPFNAPAD